MRPTPLALVGLAALASTVFVLVVDPPPIVTWLGGDPNTVADYGVKGVEISTNRLSPRYFSSITSDINGNIWVFGGYDGRFSAALLYVIPPLPLLW
jgi:hypothetical protein